MRSTNVHPEVAEALQASQPVVALETAMMTHGLPGDALPEPLPFLDDQWRTKQPVNLETALLLRRVVRSRGAVPALVGVINGELVVGLDEGQIARLAADRAAVKISTRDLAHAAFRGLSGGTTVAATLHACGNIEPQPIRVFATGGIGGVHTGWTARPDISADLAQLASSPVCTVCAGAKSILDTPATLEALETLQIPVLGYRTDAFPRFICPADESLPVPVRVEHAREIARFCAAHWGDCGLTSAVLAVREISPDRAVPADVFEYAFQRAELDAEELGISGPLRSPFLLDHVAKSTHGRSLEANLALLRANAELAAEIAVVLSELARNR